MRKKRVRCKLHALDKYVIFSIISMILYTIITQIILLKTGYTDSTLTTCFFGFFGGEIVTCALIKIFKLIDTTKTKKALLELSDGLEEMDEQ